MNLNIGDIVTLDIGKIAHGGHFISKVNNQIVFVRHGISGEVANVKITAINSKFAFGSSEGIDWLNPSGDLTLSKKIKFEERLSVSKIITNVYYGDKSV